MTNHLVFHADSSEDDIIANSSSPESGKEGEKTAVPTESGYGRRFYDAAVWALKGSDSRIEQPPTSSHGENFGRLHDVSKSFGFIFSPQESLFQLEKL